MPHEPEALQKLSPEALVVFAQGLAGLPADEVRRLKRLYVLNTVTDLRAELAGMEATYQAGCIHWMIPIFWPFAKAQRSMIRIARRRAGERVLNLVETWKDDLEGVELDLAFLEAE